MCGIAGIVRFDGGVVDSSELARMADLLEHRGPDDHGIWNGGAAGFAHRRLSIIDLAASAQPMAGAAGRLHITFNGEILNYAELRSSLAYPFRTAGDTEVLLAMFEQHGADAARRLRGQFAFAIHDRDDGSVWLFRDRLGILPLYYARSDDRLVFASEVKAVLAALPRPRTIDELSVASYLARGSVPSPWTLFEGVHKLPPGHHLRVRADGALDIAPYWTPPPSSPEPISPRRATQLVAEALDEAVAEAMVADVPVGAYLSGGLDSSLIVALMTARPDAGRVSTFSAGFDDPRSDETHHARRVSELFGTDHHEVIVRPDDFIDLWPRLTWHRDAPISQPADAAVHLLAAMARRHVKVVLSGEGSDELFAGYPKHRADRAVQLAQLLPSAARRPLLRRLELALPAGAARARVAVRAAGAGDEPDRFTRWFAPFTSEEIERLTRREQPHLAEPRQTGTDPLERMLRRDLLSWLPDNLLERGDRMSMAAGLELRPPFLDQRVVDIACSLPSSLKVRRGRGKWLVKEVAASHLPDDIVHRAKSGFRVPLDRWFRGGLRDLAHDRLLDPASLTSQLFAADEVRSLLRTHDVGRRNEEQRIWTLLGLEIWHDVFFRAPVPANGGSEP